MVFTLASLALSYYMYQSYKKNCRIYDQLDSSAEKSDNYVLQDGIIKCRNKTPPWEMDPSRPELKGILGFRNHERIIVIDRILTHMSFREKTYKEVTRVILDRNQNFYGDCEFHYWDAFDTHKIVLLNFDHAKYCVEPTVKRDETKSKYGTYTKIVKTTTTSHNIHQGDITVFGTSHCEPSSIFNPNGKYYHTLAIGDKVLVDKFVKDYLGISNSSIFDKVLFCSIVIGLSMVADYLGFKHVKQFSINQ